MLTTLILFFLVAIAGLGLMIYMDIKPTVVKPPQLNYADGLQNMAAEATATHQEDKANGEVRAESTVNGNGKAEASAELGHEFQYRGKEGKKFNPSIHFRYRAHVQVDQGEGQAGALIQTVLLPGSTNEVIKEALTEVGVKDIPGEENFTTSVQRLPPVFLEPNQKCKVFLRVTAFAEALGSEKASCRTEVIGRIAEVRLTPV